MMNMFMTKDQKSQLNASVSSDAGLASITSGYRILFAIDIIASSSILLSAFVFLHSDTVLQIIPGPLFNILFAFSTFILVAPGMLGFFCLSIISLIAAYYFNRDFPIRPQCSILMSPQLLPSRVIFFGVFVLTALIYISVEFYFIRSMMYYFGTAVQG